MIAALRGTVSAIALDHAVIDVGGVGFAVQATPATLGTLRGGTETTLATSLVVREDSLTLFGFTDGAQKDLFVLLQTVSGIGPRIALAMLAVLEPATLTSAIADGNIAVLTQVPGIGRKGAERLCVELRDKVGALDGGDSVVAPSASTGVRAAVVEALTGLGFAAKQSESAVDSVLAESSTADTSTVLRTALTTLGRKK
jgi:Holliday junction DNA helicase RuvA